ncbi:hypothetical protein KFK09_001777 [Dendrobium nobile]|uniref:CCHC-type domain-containing protein n=1 Tax=Dendrobium nobile TaxID=94219 RepID=A0A8T3C5X6_DENNO|nr:hypothetical protein KFK09_001777 [Dendrobium nobile]
MLLDQRFQTRVWVEGSFGRFFQKVEYEKVSTFCLKCGKVGHLDDKCKKDVETYHIGAKDPLGKGKQSNFPQSQKEVEVDKNYGPWILVQNLKKRKKQLSEVGKVNMKNNIFRNTKSMYVLKSSFNPNTIQFVVGDVGKGIADVPDRTFEETQAPTVNVEVTVEENVSSDAGKCMEGTLKSDFKIADVVVEDNRDQSSNEIQTNQNACLPSQGRNMFKLLSSHSSTDGGTDGFIDKVEDLEEGEINCNNSDLTVTKLRGWMNWLKVRVSFLRSLALWAKITSYIKKGRVKVIRSLKMGAIPFLNPNDVSFILEL